MKRIKILSFGGAGTKTISYIKNKGIPGAAYIAVDNDKESLLQSNADIKLTPKEFTKYLEQNDIAFVIAGLGGNCGRHLTEIAAKRLQNIACCYCFMPYQFEGVTRAENAAMTYHKLVSLGARIVKIDNNEVLNKTPDKFSGSTLADMNNMIFDYIYNHISKCMENL